MWGEVEVEGIEIYGDDEMVEYGGYNVEAGDKRIVRGWDFGE